MTDIELKSCIGTIEMLRRLHGVMNVIDAGNCEKIIKVLSDIPKYKDAYNRGWDDGAKATYEHLKMCEEETETGHCKDCKYFEYDSVAIVDGIPLIVAHEICSRWGDGCKTKEDGYCFLFEPQESETWNGIHGQITAPKGTFKKIFEDESGDRE